MKYVLLKRAEIFSILLFCSVSCTQNTSNSPYKVIIPIDDGNNHYSLQTRELHTVSDLTAMAGSAAVFKAQGRFETQVDASGQEGFTSADYGFTPSAHFIKSDDAYNPSDFMSLCMTTAMYHFENIKAFYDGFGATKVLAFPREVLINVTLDRHKGSQEAETYNNASYVANFDLFFINPYNDENIPLTINGGVLAHEYLHSIFMKIKSNAVEALKLKKKISPENLKFLENMPKTNNAVNEWYGPKGAVFVDGLTAGINDFGQAENYEPEDIKTLNNFLFASINEGVADYYGYEYSHNPKWILASLPNEQIRDLSLKKSFTASLSYQKKRFLQAAKAKTASEMLDVHGIGAFFSHFLWLVSTDANWGSEAAKAATLDFMKNYSEELALHIDDKYISMGDLVQLFFKSRAPGPSLCALIHDRFPTELGADKYNCDSPITATGGRN